ncbi:hypothetical protein PXC01_15550 [Maribacter sp. M208]|uniref:hypothetical protein n=1 Tax=Maribacter TaxID=252356 RepID=UPI0023EDD53A|nr:MULTISPECIES: hypothetical protein [Maribacter]MDF4223019.1 hypothetical protein [Maribacter huludaoensis]
MKRVCPECNNEVIGRTDKIFCSVKCKSIHQYEKSQIENTFYFSVDKQLKRNRKILKRYNKSGFTTIRKSILLEEGFNPKFFTHYWKNQKNDVYLFCYDFGFLKTTKNGVTKYVIVQWQDYMNK